MTDLEILSAIESEDRVTWLTALSSCLEAEGLQERERYPWSLFTLKKMTPFIKHLE